MKHEVSYMFLTDWEKKVFIHCCMCRCVLDESTGDCAGGDNNGAADE